MGAGEERNESSYLGLVVSLKSLWVSRAGRWEGKAAHKSGKTRPWRWTGTCEENLEPTKTNWNQHLSLTNSAGAMWKKLCQGMHSFLAEHLEKLKDEIWQEPQELWTQSLPHTNQEIQQVKQYIWPSAARKALNCSLSMMPVGRNKDLCLCMQTGLVQRSQALESNIYDFKPDFICLR